MGETFPGFECLSRSHIGDDIDFSPALPAETIQEPHRNRAGLVWDSVDSVARTVPRDFEVNRAGSEGLVRIGRGGTIILKHLGGADTLPHSGVWDFNRQNMKLCQAEQNIKLNDTLVSEAVALQKAHELHQHVEGSSECDGVILWGKTECFVFKTDWPEDNTDEEVFHRYDYQDSLCGYPDTINRKQALGLTNKGVFMHVGQHVPHRVTRWAKMPSDAAPAVMNDCAGSGAGRWLLTLIEFCCSKDSRLCDVRYIRPGVRAIRLTIESDMTTDKGKKLALSIINDPNSGHVVLFCSMPCTYGCSFQMTTERKLMNSNPKALPAFY